jgi:hypothetical protein
MFDQYRPDPAFYGDLWLFDLASSDWSWAAGPTEVDCSAVVPVPNNVAFGGAPASTVHTLPTKLHTDRLFVSHFLRRVCVGPWRQQAGTNAHPHCRAYAGADARESDLSIWIYGSPTQTRTRLEGT